MCSVRFLGELPAAGRVENKPMKISGQWKVLHASVMTISTMVAPIARMAAGIGVGRHRYASASYHSRRIKRRSYV